MEEMTHYAVKIAYIGKSFHGSQRQPNVRTVEGDIIKALKKIGAIEGADESDLRSAGRTDKGVTALGNVVSFYSDMPRENLFPALSANLEDIFPMAYGEVGPDFNPRRAKERWYRYHLPIEGHNIEKMVEAAKLFVGYHDFTHFAKVEEDRDPKRRINSVEILDYDDFILVDVKGESFLWNMVRRMTMALSMVGRGECVDVDIQGALEGGGNIVFPPLHPGGLVLMDVAYTDIAFKANDTHIGKRRLENMLREQTVEHRIIEEIFLAL